MARAHFVKKARVAKPEYDIKVGESYYWWKFNYGAMHCSKTEPKRSQLTQSGFLSQLYEIEDGFAFEEENPQECIDNLIGDLESLKEECENNLENMPEQLQESSASADTLRERIDGLDDWISSLQNIDTEIDDKLNKKRLSKAEKEEQQNRLDEIKDEIESANPGLG